MMNLETFEQLWPDRTNLDSSLRAELEKMAKTDKHCKAFVDGGDWVREMLSDIDPETAPAGFAYQMRAYAVNHAGSAPPEKERSWLRWPVVTVGAAAGVAAMLFAINPMLQDGAQTGMPDGMAEGNTPTAQEMAPAPDASMQNQLLAEGTDSSVVADSLKSVERDLPDWQLHTVSTGNE